MPKFVLKSDLSVGTVRAMTDWAWATTRTLLLQANGQLTAEERTDLPDALRTLTVSALPARPIATTGKLTLTEGANAGREIRLPTQWTIAIGAMLEAGLTRVPVFSKDDLKALVGVSRGMDGDPTKALTDEQASRIGNVLEGLGYEVTDDPSKVSGTATTRSSGIPERTDDPNETRRLYEMPSEPLGGAKSSDALVVEAAEKELAKDASGPGPDKKPGGGEEGKPPDGGGAGEVK